MLGPHPHPHFTPACSQVWGEGQRCSQTFLQPMDTSFGGSARVCWMIGWVFNFY